MLKYIFDDNENGLLYAIKPIIPKVYILLNRPVIKMERFFQIWYFEIFVLNLNHRNVHVGDVMRC